MPKGFRAVGFMRLLKAQHPQPCPQILVEHAVRLKSNSTNVYAIYRNPETRLLSAFQYHLHAPGMKGWDHEHLLVPRCIYLCVTHVKAVACGAQVLTQTPYACPQCMPDVSPYTRVNREGSLERKFKAFIDFKGIQGCQLKQTLGDACGKGEVHDIRNLARMLKSAIAFVQSSSVVFFGFNDDWHRTMCLFGKTTGMVYDKAMDFDMRNTSQNTVFKFDNHFVTGWERQYLDATMVRSNKPLDNGTSSSNGPLDDGTGGSEVGLNY